MAEELMLRYPCIEGWGSQCYHNNHKGLDFGWCSSKGKGNTDIQACADGVVEFEGYYKQVFGNRVYKPIGVIIRHTQFSDEYDYISIYWHMKNTIINKGDVVKKGQKLGLKGCTGYVTPSGAIHLHFQLLKIPKGASIPDQHYPSKADNWGKVSINPTDLLYVYSDQHFREDCSAFKLKKYVEEDFKSKYDKLKIDYTALEDDYNVLNGKYETLLKEKAEIEEELNSLKERYLYV